MTVALNDELLSILKCHSPGGDTSQSSRSIQKDRRAFYSLDVERFGLLRLADFNERRSVARGSLTFYVRHSRWNRWNKKLTRSSSSEFFLSDSDTYIVERFEAFVHKIRHEYIFLYKKL